MTGLISNAFAQQSADPCGTTTFDCYQESGFQLASNPVVCMDLPSDRNLIGYLRASTQDAVIKWQNIIDHAGMPWNIQLLPDTTSSACNITVQYLPHPDNSENFPPDVSGVTELQNNNTALIQVYYDGVDQDYQGNYYFVNSLAPDYQIRWTIMHELGHAFGLGHYVTSDNSTISSIMIPQVPVQYTVPNDAGVITPQPVITTQDVIQLKSLYQNGFNNQQSNSNIPSVPTPEMSPSEISYWTPLIKNYFGNSSNTIASSDYSNNVLSLVDVFDSAHLVSIPDPVGNQTGVKFWMQMPSWLANDFSWWANGMISDNDLASSMQSLYDNKIFCFGLTLPRMHQVNATTWSNEGSICG